MAHDIWRDSQGMDHMMMVGKREDAWHQLGQRIIGAATVDDAIRLAGLDHTYVKQDLYALDPSKATVKVPMVAIFRTSDNAYVGTVGPDYEIVQIREAFSWMDGMMQADGGAHYDSAGMLGARGERVWISARIPGGDFNVRGNPHIMYLVFATSFDGSMRNMMYTTSTQTVCANTLRAGMREAEAMFSRKHTKNAKADFAKARNLVAEGVLDSKKLAEKLQALATRKVRKESLMKVLDRLFPAPENPDASESRRKNTMVEVLALYESNDKNAIPANKGTAYNLLNAVTEYADHHRTARITSAREGWTETRARAENAVIGTGQKLKSAALAVIEEETANDPTYDPETFGPGREITEDEFNRMMGDDEEGTAAA